MKNKLLNFGLLNFFRQLLHGKKQRNSLELKKSKRAVENNLRWEDDGGPVMENDAIDPSNPDMTKEVIKE